MFDTSMRTLNITTLIFPTGGMIICVQWWTFSNHNEVSNDNDQQYFSCIYEIIKMIVDVSILSPTQFKMQYF